MMTLILIVFPLVAGLLVFGSGNSTARNTALISSLIQLLLTIAVVVGFDPRGGMQHVLDVPWIKSFGIHFHVGIDGINLLLVLLTSLLLPLIIWSCAKSEQESPSKYFGLMLMMQAALTGVFTAQDGFLFYIFWELALIPIWFICLLWGGKDRERITFKFFAYTLAGSLMMLVALIYVYLRTPLNHSFDWQALVSAGRSLGAQEQGLLFWGLFLAFAIKIPVFPFHTWQPDTYTNAPTQGSMLLSGIMLKMGLYGLLKWLLPVVPLGVEEFSALAIGLSVAGILYASFIAIMQSDFKRLIAFSSIAHVGLIAAGIMTGNIQGIQGGLYQMLSHGINVVGLFYISGLLENRTGTRELGAMGGVRNVAPVFATLFMIIMLGSVALPLTNGFVGEFMLLGSVYQYGMWTAALAGTTIILGAVYMLTAYQKSMLGEVSSTTASFQDVSADEKRILLVISALVLLGGILPSFLLDLSAPSAERLLDIIKNGFPG
jgi:NADH-quinone oxidoreductase subunit M